VVSARIGNVAAARWAHAQIDQCVFDQPECWPVSFGV
jgi:hypothetical protein